MNGTSEVITLSNFHSTRLNNERRLFIYLPQGYREQLNRRYPVLYMQAGQRAFAPVQEGTESWNTHLAADRLIAAGLMEPIIIVAIAHVRPAQTNEYYHDMVPKEEQQHVRGSGFDYEHFVIHEVKPYIDSRFRTLPDAPNTAMMGSSAGALVTYNIGFRNPDVFGKLMMLSPYFIKARLNALTPGYLTEEPLYKLYPRNPGQKLWFDIGDAEGLFLPQHVRDVVDAYLAQGCACPEELAYLNMPEAAHQEKDWGERVHLPLLYMFGNPGRPVSLEIRSRQTVGLRGMEVRVEALLRYDTGFMMSLPHAEYVSSDPEVLAIEPNGRLVPKQTGQAVISLTLDGLRAVRPITVVEELKPYVTVCMRVRVPAETPADAELYGGMGLHLERLAPDRFAGTFEVPRDTAYQFRFTHGFRKFETDAKGKPLANRKFRASEDLELDYEVVRWEGQQQARPERRENADHFTF